MKPNVMDINTATNQITIREMTDLEFESYLARQDEPETL